MFWGLPHLNQTTKKAFRVNAKIRQRIARAKQKIESRLAAAVTMNEAGPVTRGRPYYELSDRARGNAWGGIGAFSHVSRCAVQKTAQLGRRAWRGVWGELCRRCLRRSPCGSA